MIYKDKKNYLFNAIDKSSLTVCALTQGNVVTVW